MEAARGRERLRPGSVVFATLIAWTLGSYGIAVVSGGTDAGLNAGPSWPPFWLVGCVLIVAAGYLLDRGQAAGELAGLIAWTVFMVFQALFGRGGARSCLQTVTDGALVGYTLCGFDESKGVWPQVTIWMFGVVIILAIGDAIRDGPRLASIAATLWTIGFIGVSIFGAREIVCPPPQGGYTNCYLAWSPGFFPFAVWIAGVLLIIGIRYLATVRAERGQGDTT